MAVTADQVQQLYIAYFNRPADFLGLSFQVNQANQFGLQFVADQFSKSPEYLATYAGKGTAEVIDTIYMNLFGRHAEPAGIKFWGDLLTNPKSGITLGNAAITIATGAINDDKVSVANKLIAANAFYASLDTSAEIVGYSGDAANGVLKTWMSGITTQATLDAAITPAALLTVSTAATAAHDGALVVNVALTTGVDTKTGSAGNDSFNGTIGNLVPADNTLTVLDTIDGGAGNDVLNVTDLAGGSKLPASLTLTSVETVNLISAGAAGATGAGNSFDTSGLAGVTTVTVSKSTGADFITAGSGQAVTVNDTAGKVTVTGGSSQTVNTAGGVALSGSAGAIVVNDTSATVNSTIDDGSTVKVNLSSAASTGTLTIGSTGHKPTGAVTVTSSLAPTASAVVSGGLITVNGGTSVSVTQTAVQPILTAAGTNVTTTQSAVTVNGGAATTDVTVKQAAVVAPLPTVVGVAYATESASVVFSALAANTTVILGGLTFTAGATGATAKQVAAAFASISDAVSPSWTTGAVSGANSDTVTFTATSSGPIGDLLATGTGVLPTIVTTQGAGVDAAGRGGIDEGVVTISDAAGTIKTVTLGNYGNSAITSDALATLNLSGKSGTLSITNAVGGALDLNLSAVSANGSSAITDASNKYTTVKVHTSTGSSTLSNLTSSSVTALTVDGANTLTLTTAAGLTALKTVTVSGAAGLSMTAGVAATVTDINASATTGNVSVALALGATYEGGSGNDNVIVSAAPTAAISGGAGTDTLTLNFAGYNASANTNISGFETLGLGAAATGAYDATGFLHLTEGAVTAAVSYTNVAAGVDLAITANTGFGTTYTLKDATGTADSLTVAIKGGAIAAGTLTAAGIESIALSATNTSSSAVAGATADSITIVDAALKSMTVTGNTTLTLVNTGNVALTSVDASAMTGGLVYTTAGTVAETVKGGATSNTLTAGVGTTADVLIGGASNDKLVANAGLDTLTGGAGNDTFVIGVASGNVNSYATITDAKAGDVIQFLDIAATVEAFSASKITLAATAVFQDFANAAINSNNVAGAISWFQYGGDTYVVENAGTAGVLNFENGIDLIVKLTGAVDLSTATFLSAGGVPTILIH